jgi:hypothetical protein
VTRDGFVSYNGNAYSVPDGTGRRGIDLYATLTELRLVHAGQVIATHTLVEGRGQRILLPGHRMVRGSARSPVSLAPPTEVIEVQRRPLDVYEQVLR